jgi:hypothetical protein
MNDKNIMENNYNDIYSSIIKEIPMLRIVIYLSDCLLKYIIINEITKN